MPKYKNLSGNSGVVAYETGDDYIIVAFDVDAIYLYDYEKPGKDHVEHMKKLAQKGLGLSTYISQEIREEFSKKLR